MPTLSINKTTKRLEKLMYGFNYAVTFGIDIFENCSTLDKFQELLKSKYSKVNAGQYQPILYGQTEFWEDVNYGLTWRGEEGAWLKLSVKKESELLVEQSKLKDFLTQHLSDSTKIYSYPEELGMPGYDVYWGYTFLFLNEDKPSILFYGSASD